MTWLLFKNKVKIIFSWLKEHWQIPFLAAWTILVYIMTRRNTDALLEVMEARKESYKKQLEVLRDTHNREILERQKLTEKYEDTLKKIEEEFKKKEKELSAKEKTDIKEMVIKSKGNPDDIKKRIEEEFGIKFVQ